MTAQPDPHTFSSLTKTIELLRSDFASQYQTKAGYIDLLANQDSPRPPLGQRAFHIKLMPLIYERLWRPLVARFLVGKELSDDEERRLILRMLDLSPGNRALDVGCGPGNYTRLLAGATGDGLVVGIDPSQAMITTAVKRGGSASLAYVRGNGDVLPFRSDQFDAVCCVGVIHLLEDPMGALDEMIRVLAPGGRVAIAATCRKGKEPRVNRVGVTVFERDELTAALAARGLTQVDQRVARRWQIVSARRSPE